MKILFPALETRFNASATLKVAGRKLVRKTESTTPYTLVEAGVPETEDTFTSDIEKYAVTFSFVSKSSVLPTRADEWLERMIEVFDDANLTSDDFTTSGCVRTGKADPEYSEGRWRASIEYEITIQRTVNLPETRHA